MAVANTTRIVLLGKIGTGKTSLANTIFGEAKFKINQKMQLSRSETKSVDGRSLTLIDIPGFFHPGRSEVDMKLQMVKCITDCSPGPHAFLIVLKVEKFTEHERKVISKIQESFSEEAFKHAVVVFTHGDQLPNDIKIEDFVGQSEGLRDLVKVCGGRCHVVDNKYWKNQQDGYRNNQVQVEALLNTIDRMIQANGGGYYTNEMLQAVEREIQKEEVHIRQKSKDMSQEEIRQQAKENVFNKQGEKAPQTWIKGFLGVTVVVGVIAAVSAVLFKFKLEKILTETPLSDQLPPVLVEVVEQILEPPAVSLPAITITEVVEEAPVRTWQAFDIMEKFRDLYERTYNPWNPFE